MTHSNKQQLLAFILIMLVLFLTPKYMEYISPPAENQPPALFDEEVSSQSSKSTFYNSIEKDFSSFFT